MLGKFIPTILSTIIFYIAINKIYRVDELNKYTEKAKTKGLYNEQYKNAYSNYLNVRCTLLTVVFLVIMIAKQFIGSILSMIIGITLGMLIAPILGKYYPKPKENI